MFTKTEKKAISHIMRNMRHYGDHIGNDYDDMMIFSLRETEHRRADGSEDIIAYGIVPSDEFENESPTTFFENMRVDWPPFGQMFTVSLHYHLNPSGDWSYVHHLQLNV